MGRTSASHYRFGNVNDSIKKEGYMSTVEKVITIALSLVALFLVLNNAGKVSEIMTALGGFTTPTLRTLQGKD